MVEQWHRQISPVSFTAHFRWTCDWLQGYNGIHRSCCDFKCQVVAVCEQQVKIRPTEENCTNPLWPSNEIYREASYSKLIHVMACCLLGQILYLNPFWFVDFLDPTEHISMIPCLIVFNGKLTFKLLFAKWQPLCSNLSLSSMGNLVTYL